MKRGSSKKAVSKYNNRSKREPLTTFKKKKVCLKCKKEILLKEKYVLIGTYVDKFKNIADVIEERWFHITEEHLKRGTSIKL